jgi:hypothetical protein
MHISQVRAVKISLISATSILALLSVSAGLARAAVLSEVSAQSNLYDLVHDGMTSSDGGDRTVTSQDLSVTATMALAAATSHWQTATFVGPVDLTATTQGFPTTSLGAVPGTKPDDDLASSVVSGQWDASRKARAIGQARIASLIGTVGNGPPPNDKSDSTVFVAAGSSIGFSDGGGEVGGARESVYAFAPSSTSSATITVAGAGNLSRQGFGGGFGVLAANSLRAGSPTVAYAAPPPGDSGPSSVALADTLQPTLGYRYAPVRQPAAKDEAEAAGFSGAMTASGNLARNLTAGPGATVQTSQLPLGVGQQGRSVNGRFQTSQSLTGAGQPSRSANGKIRSSQLQTAAGQPGQSATGNVKTSELQPDRLQSGEAAARLSQLIDLSATIQGPPSATHVDGTNAFISASVSANPSATAALYMANVINSVRTVPAGQTVEAFEIGPASGPRNPANAGTTVADPLHGKVMASAGALNNSLALP